MPVSDVIRIVNTQNFGWEKWKSMFYSQKMHIWHGVTFSFINPMMGKLYFFLTFGISVIDYFCVPGWPGCFFIKIYAQASICSRFVCFNRYIHWCMYRDKTIAVFFNNNVFSPKMWFGNILARSSNLKWFLIFEYVPCHNNMPSWLFAVWNQESIA